MIFLVRFVHAVAIWCRQSSGLVVEHAALGLFTSLECRDPVVWVFDWRGLSYASLPVALVEAVVNDGEIQSFYLPFPGSRPA